MNNGTENAAGRSVYKRDEAFLPAGGNPVAEGATQRPEDTPTAAAREQHWIFLDVCKVLAVLLIVVLHVSSGAWSESEVGTFDWHVLNVFNALSRIGIPLFFMQVGAVFLNKKNDMPVKTLYTGYILRIVSAFFIWSAFYMVTYYLFDAPGGFGEFTVPSFITGLLGGAPYSQWFVLLAISLYLIIPILRAIARDMRAVKYFLALWVLFSILLPTLYRLPTIFPGISPSLAEGVSVAANAVNQVRPAMVMEFPGYMLLGYYLHQTEFSGKATLWAVALGTGSLLYTVLMTVQISYRNGVPTEAFLGNLSINICLMTVAVTIAVKTLLKRVWFGPKTYRVLRFFSDVSLGIFLIHDFLRMGLVRLGIDALTFPAILSVPVLAIVVFVVSGGVAYWLKRLPIVGPFIVGG